MASDNSDGEREAKRLRSSEPDLKVVLGGGDGEEIVQWHHADLISSKSQYSELVHEVHRCWCRVHRFVQLPQRIDLTLQPPLQLYVRS